MTAFRYPIAPGCGFMLCASLFFAQFQFSQEMQGITVDDTVVERIDAGRVSILANARLVSFSSAPAPYLDCEGYRELMRLDNKIIPLLIHEMVRWENASIIYGKGHYLPGPENNREWLERARVEREEIWGRTIPSFICLIALAKTSFGRAGHRTGFDGIEETYQWLSWWKENKGRYALTFKGSETFDVGDLDGGKLWPRLSCKMINGLLDVRAAGATFKNIVENVAAEAGVNVVVGDDDRKSSYMGGRSHHIAGARYEEMTFDEFAFALAEQLAPSIPWRKEGNTYYFGTGDPAPGRWMMDRRPKDLICEIRMDKTVFRMGERMPLDISLRYPNPRGTGIEVIAGSPPEEFPVFVFQVINDAGSLLHREPAAGTAMTRLSTCHLGGAENAKQFLGEIDLCRIFKFEEPGDYAVSVTYKVGQDTNPGEPVWRGEAVSGSVYVKIVR